jgi:hypothetical protein
LAYRLGAAKEPGHLHACVRLAAGQNAAFAFTATVAVLVIAFPSALGLATATALDVGSGRGGRQSSVAHAALPGQSPTDTQPRTT